MRSVWLSYLVIRANINLYEILTMLCRQKFLHHAHARVARS